MNLTPMPMNKEYIKADATKYMLLGLMEFLENSEEGSEAYKKAQKYLEMLVNDEITLKLEEYENE